MNNSILIKIENQVAYITLNRPDVFNSFQPRNGIVTSKYIG